MKRLYPRCAGLDVHKEQVVACARTEAHGRVQREVATFSTTTPGLIALADWLETHACTHVAMEATEVYWRPVWHVLEARYHLILANAAQASSEFTLDQAAAMTTAIAPTTTSVTAHIKSKLIQFFRSAARPTRR
jgi:transposase